MIPGLWLMTRWSLFAPVIVSELLGPLEALRRSNELVRGHFELVFLTAALAVVLEEAIADAGTLGGLALTGSETWGQWIGGSVATVLILPVASFATALAYGHLRRLKSLLILLNNPGISRRFTLTRALPAGGPSRRPSPGSC